jgi:TPR repeat protein
MTMSGHAANRLILAAVVLSIGVGAPALADYKTGYEAYKAEDFAAAFGAWLPLANENDALAQHALGIMYKQDRGVARDDGPQAPAWIRKAAGQGDKEEIKRTRGPFFARFDRQGGHHPPVAQGPRRRGEGA